MRKIIGVILSTMLALSLTVVPVLPGRANVSTTPAAAAPVAAAAMIMYQPCKDLDWPIGIYVQRIPVGGFGPILVRAFSPINGIAHFYAEDNGADPHNAFYTAGIYANQYLDYVGIAKLPHRYWIAVTPWSGTIWYEAGTSPIKIMLSCHSRLLYMP
jgi:hypothetical protein